MRFFWLAATLILTQSAGAAEKPIRFWNLTAGTVTKLELAAAGTGAFGPNQCSNDKDGGVDHDERLALAGISPGLYDLNIGYADGRVCSVDKVKLEAGKVFAVEEKDLKNCRK